jgi:hypothetical protein
MTSQVRRITVSLPPEQIRGLKRVSKMLKQPVSGLVSDLIGDAVLQFEQLVIHRDTEGARARIQQLTQDAEIAIKAVENVKRQ